MPKDRIDRAEALKKEASQGDPQKAGGEGRLGQGGMVKGMSTEALDAMWRHPALGERSNATLKAAVLGELARRKGPDWTRAAVKDGGPGSGVASPDGDGASGQTGMTAELAPVYAQLAETPELFLDGSGEVAELHEQDVSAGKLAECHFVAALTALEMRDPVAIQEMVKPIGGGEYQVTFKDGTVIVDDTFTFESAEAVYAGKGDRTGDERELWAMLLEKAWAKLQGGYEVINGQQVLITSKDAMEALSGRESKVLTTDSLSEADLLAMLGAAEAKGLAVMASTRPKKSFSEGELDAMGDRGVAANHAYTVVSVVPTARTVNLHNPRAAGQNHPDLPIADFQHWFGKVRVSPG